LATRLTLLTEPAFAELKPLLSERLAWIGANLRAEQLGSLVDPLMREILQQGFSEAGADEGTIWLLDEAGENLVPAYNTGPGAEQLVGRFKQPLTAGLISMVFASEQPFLENEVAKNAQQSKLLDSLLQTQTSAMIAVPFYFLDDCRGVVSRVQLKPSGSRDAGPAGFRPEHLAGIQRVAALLSKLIEFQLLSKTVGWTSE
jgi:hypothetical protein